MRWLFWGIGVVLLLTLVAFMRIFR